MKFGLVFCSYNTPKYTIESITPWINLKDKLNIYISACHGLFKEYYENGVLDNDSDGLDKLLSLNINKKIDYLYVQNHYGVDFARDIKKYETEAQIRNYCVQELLKQEVDYIILWDSDEIATEIEIENFIQYIQKNSLYTWFSINYKNLVFSENQYIDGFCPPRAFKTITNNYKLKEIYWDNDFSYFNLKTGENKSYKDFSSKMIPKTIIYPKHYTWLSDNRSKEKINYQMKHFGHCGYKWNDKEDKLEFNEEFYQKTYQILPKVLEC